MASGLWREALWAFKPTREGNTVVLAQRTPSRPKRAVLQARAEAIEARWGLPATKWLRVFKPVVAEVPAMKRVAPPPPPPPRRFAAFHVGPVHWRQPGRLAARRRRDHRRRGQRTIARCSQAESAQHPLVRLASVSACARQRRPPLDIEALTQHLAKRAGLPYLRIDPLRWMWARWPTP
jgi:hypothetical protein